MHRLVAIVLVLALGVASGASSALHVHAYTDHDHAEHHHGPAVHDHDAADTRHDNDAVRLESCDPGRHRVTMAFVCGTAERPSGLVAESVGPAIALADAPSRHAAPVTDVRVHGPPPSGPTSPRAPPLELHRLIT